MTTEQYSRTAMLIGCRGIKKLKASSVIVFGLGGVGSFCVEALARAGVGRLILVDHDRICMSNINRQLHALHSTVGRDKTAVMKERVLDIDPGIEVIARTELYTPGRAEEFLSPDLDYVVDAIDLVPAKIDLIKEAKQRGIPVISSMGAGNKLDPTQLKVDDLSRTTVCPLARVVRRELRKKGIDQGVKVVYSLEPPVKPLPEESLLDAGSGDGKRSFPGSISYVPSVAGLFLAGEVIRDLLGVDNR